MPSWKKVIVSGSSPVLANITASSNISASGNVIASNVYLPGQGIISFDDTLDGTDQYVSGKDHNISIQGDNYINLYANDAAGHVHIKSPTLKISQSVAGAGGHALFVDGSISASSAIVPLADAGADLGSSVLEWNNLYIDGTANIDSLVADTADINAGTVDLITSLTVANDVNIGSYDITAVEFKGNLVGTVNTATQNSITTATGLTSVGALNAGSITSGFTSINVGAGSITTTGVATLTTVYADTRKFVKTSTVAGNHEGDVVFMGGTEDMTPGAIYHYVAAGTWTLANAAAAATSKGLLAVALGEASDEDGMLLRGMVTLSADPSATLADVLFISAATAGRATPTAPSGASQVVRIIGYSLDSTDDQIWFNPDNIYVEISAD